jgi:hypothetical protein
LYFAASVLDPQQKLRNIQQQYADLAEEKIQEIKAWFKKEYQPKMPMTSQPQLIKLPASMNTHQINLLKRAQKPLNAQSDIDRYLNSDVLEWDDNDIGNYNPEFVLKWWKANESQYPTMAKAARDLLAIPGSEVDVERLFCGGRDLLGIQ